MKQISLWVNILMIAALAACSYPVSSATQPAAQKAAVTATSAVEALTANEPAVESQETQATPTSTDLPDPTPEPVEPAAPTATHTAVPAAEEPPAVLGPDEFPAGTNPLTGLPCDSPELLNLPPALISVSNFPVTARPQAGLSFSPYVFELYIGEGMTRFLAMFYCSFPGENLSGDNTIGPIRSGRLPYEGLRRLYNGFLIMASASGEVGAQISDSTNIFGSDADNINSALIDVGKLQGIAQQQAGSQPPNLTGNLFSQTPPKGGQPADQLWVFYNFLNQVLWTYDSAAGAYLRAQDNADGSGAFTPSTDRLTGEALAFENVIVLYADHEVLNSEGTLIDVNLLYSANKAFLFRDGKMFPIRWSTVGGEYEKTTGKMRPMRFVDSEGNPVALKPGSVWVEMVHLTTTLQETDPGKWKARFYAP